MSQACVFLMQLGGPRDQSAIEPFLCNLFEDIFPVPRLVRGPIARWAAKKRAQKIAPNYQEIGGGSPILSETQAQADALKVALLARGVDAFVGICMRYSPPRTLEVLTQARSGDGDVPWIELPLYPHYSQATTGSSHEELWTFLSREERRRLHVIESYPDHQGLIDAILARIDEAILEFEPQELRRLQIVFSAHSLPLRMVKAGDPYPHHIHRTVQTVMRRLSVKAPCHLAYQSKVGPVAWLEPSSIQMVETLAAKGHEHLLIVPVSFVSEHIETLHELDIALRQLAMARGVKRFVRARTVGTHAAFVGALAELVMSKLSA